MIKEISVYEYAKLKGCTPQSVYYNIKKGKLPVVEETKVIHRIPYDTELGEACQQ